MTNPALTALTPAGAKALIVAEFEVDASDMMSDYFATKTERRVALAWSAHDRDLFPELRKAAAHFPETAALATAPQDAEHREKYSMGAGYYLKGSSRYSTGWKVRKVGPSWYDYDLDLTLLGTPAAALEAPVAGPVSAPTMTLNAEKSGVEIRFPAKPADDVRASLKANGWRWSRFSSVWYRKDTPDAREFAERLVSAP